MDESDSHIGVTPDDKDILSELSGSGESISKTTTSDGFIAVNNLANYGDETLNGDVIANGWIYNQRRTERKPGVGKQWSPGC